MPIKSALVACAAAILAAAIYTTRLGESPIYLLHDEVKYALQARAVAATGRDINGRLLPVYFSEPGFPAGRDPLSIYATAALLTRLPLSQSTIRLPTAMVAVIDVLLMFFLTRRIVGRDDVAGIAAVLLALTPAHFINGRIGVAVLYGLPFILGWLLCLARHLERGRLTPLVVGTVLLGAGTYSYLAAAMLMPLYLLITGAVLLCRRAPVRMYACALAGFVAPLVPLAWWHAQHPERYTDLMTAYRVTATAGAGASFVTLPRLSAYWYCFNPSFLFFTGDSSLTASTREAGVFLLPTAVLLVVGLYRILVHQRTPLMLSIVAGFVTAPLPAVLAGPLEVRRTLAMLPFAIVIAAVAVDGMVSAPRRRIAAGALLLLALSVAQFTSFYRDYFGPYRVSSSYWFGGDIKQALIAAMDRTPNARPVYLSTSIPYIDAYWQLYTRMHGRADLLNEAVYLDDAEPAGTSAPIGSLLVGPAGNDRARLPAAAGWAKVSTIAEPTGTPLFAVFQK